MIIAGKLSNGDDACNFLLNLGFKIKNHNNVYRQAVPSEKIGTIKGNYNLVYSVDAPTDITVVSLGDKVIYIDTENTL